MWQVISAFGVELSELSCWSWVDLIGHILETRVWFEIQREITEVPHFLRLPSLTLFPSPLYIFTFSFPWVKTNKMMCSTEIPLLRIPMKSGVGRRRKEITWAQGSAYPLFCTYTQGIYTCTHVLYASYAMYSKRGEDNNNPIAHSTNKRFGESK